MTQYPYRSFIHSTSPASYRSSSSLITTPTLAPFSVVNFSRCGSFSKERQSSKLIQQLRAVQTRLLPFGCVSRVDRTSVRILQQALIDFSRSEKHPPRLVSRAAISAQDSFTSMAFLMVRKYFSCSRQAFLNSWNCSSLGSYCANADSSKRQWQLGDFLMILRAILRTVHWNLMMKYMKISSLFLEMLKSFRIFQNSFVIQLAIELTVLRYSTNRRTSVTLGANTRESQISRQEARSLSSQTRQREISLERVGSVPGGSSMNLPSVCFLMRRRVLWGLESRKGCVPKASKQAMQPAAQTSHLKEQPSFLSCSGEAQRKVPLSSEKLSTFDMSSAPTIFAHPKSPIFTTLPLPSRMFYGFRSRWMTPRTDMSRKARRICLKMSSISWVGRVLAYCRQWLRSPYSQYSMMICIYSSSSSKWYSQTLTRLGWVNFFMSSISRSACSTWKGSTLIFLRAKGYSASFRTRQTQPKLPYPIMCIALQDCISCGLCAA